jgi:hypothetical protein
MPGPTNDVKLNIRAEAQGLAPIIQQIRDLAAALSAIGIQPAQWLGKGPMGEPPATYMQAVIGRGGYATYSYAENKALIEGALSSAQKAATIYGVTPTPSQTLEHESENFRQWRESTRSVGGTGGSFVSGVAGVPEGWGYTASGRPQVTREPYDVARAAKEGKTYVFVEEEGKVVSKEVPPQYTDEIRRGAERAKPDRSAALWGLMFQVFFGVLFGGFQEYLQAGASGVPPRTGMWTLAPAIGNLIGMGIGSLFGPFGAIAGGMLGHLGGMFISATAEAEITGRAAWLRYQYITGDRSYSHWQYNNKLWWWILNVMGDTAKRTTTANVMTTFWDWQIGQRNSEAFLKFIEDAYGFGANSPEAARFLEGIKKYYRNPLLRPYYGPRANKMEFTSEGLLAHYLVGGEEAAMDYLYTHRGAVGSMRDTVLPYRRARESMEMTAEWYAPWMGVYTGMLDYASNVGPQTFAQAMGTMRYMMMSNYAATFNAYSTLAASPGATSLAAKLELNRLQAQMAEISLQMRMLRMMPTPMDPQLVFTLDVVDQARYAAGKLPWGVLRGMGGIGGLAGDELVSLLNPLGEAGFGEVFGEAWSVNRAPSMRRMLRYRANKLAEAIRGIRSDFERQTAGLEAGSEQYRSIAVEAERRAWPYRQALIDTLSLLTEGWMERLVSETWGSPVRAQGVMHKFNYMTAGAAYERLGWGTNRVFGGFAGATGARTLSGATDIETGLGTFASQQVNVYVNVNGKQAKLEPQIESQIKEHAAAIAVSLQNSRVGNAA